MRFYPKIIFKTVTTLVSVPVIMAIAYLWYMQEQGNFHPITPGEAYRSAQLDRDLLEYYISRYKIRSVLNLRGENAGEPWYAQETAICRKFDVRHFDFSGLSAHKTPSLREIETLLRLFRIAPRPILIHCQGGADRTGLAAAFWKIVMDGSPKPVAKKQLSIRYGHMPLGPTRALDSFLDNWAMPAKTKVYGEAMSVKRFNHNCS